MDENLTEKELKNWEKEKKYIPIMIRMYCHHHHHTHGKKLCPECQELQDFALFRLDKCPFKKNKEFCSFCKVHCYKSRPELRERMKEVMRYSGPRSIFTHPTWAISHGYKTMKMIKAKKKEEKQIKNAVH